MKYRIDMKEFQDGHKKYIPMKKGVFWPFWSPFYDQCEWCNHSFDTLEEAEHFIRVKIAEFRRYAVKQKTVVKCLNYHDLISESPIRFQIRSLLESMDATGVVHYLREVDEQYFVYERVPLTPDEESQWIYQRYKVDPYLRLNLVGTPASIPERDGILIYEQRD